MSDLPPARPDSMFAVRAAMKAAEEAAEARAKAKAEARARAAAGELEPGDEDWEVIAATAVDRWAFEHGDDADAPAPIVLEPDTGAAALPEDLDALVEAVERGLPEMPRDEVHGDLVIKSHEEKVKAWYDLAAEEALPASLRDADGPLDIRRLLTALIVEVGDVKRTNAMLMEQLTRIEEKVERTNRTLRNNKTY